MEAIDTRGPARAGGWRHQDRSCPDRRGRIYAGLIHALHNVTGTRGDGSYAVAYGAVSTDQIARTRTITKDETARLIDALDEAALRISRETRRGVADGVFVITTDEATIGGQRWWGPKAARSV